MTNLAEFFEASHPAIDPLWIDLTSMIRVKAAANPRHLQKELGPSEIGHPCMRKLTYGLMEVPRCNPEYDPLPSIFGVAMHTWLQGAADYANECLGRERWLTENRVNVDPALSGSSDLYDVDTQTVIDWKALGYTSYDKYVKNIGPTYRGQVHLYGKGFVNAGYPVRRVGVAILPRSGTLSKLHLHLEDFDLEYANSILARRDRVLCMINDLGIETDPARYQWIEIAPSECVFCPWFRPEPRNPLQCNGKQ